MREGWCHNVWLNRTSAKEMGRRITEFLDALTPRAIAKIWPDNSAYTALLDDVRLAARTVFPARNTKPAHLRELREQQRVPVRER